MEDIKLWEEYTKNKSPEIREDIINKYARLVKIVVGRMNIYTNSQIEYEDLIGYGIFGLIDAIEKFDYKKGYKFETYASLRIRGEIIDNIRKLDWIPRSLRQKNKIIEDAIEKFELQNGDKPTEEELSKILDMPIENVKDYLKNYSLYNLVSLDGYLEQNHEKPVDSLIENEKYLPEKVLQKNEEKKILIEAINSLTEKQKQVITLYYYEELTLKEISKILGVSESRVSQIHSNCMKILKNKLGKNYNILYL
ncbi:FliA/WhiG family RNA polymerase sigma factor [uncultured Tyzzerella sp.]|uniref:FliA/WhiG family RNA polymerase sigma factor n=1 Tax=uncultured Tyzzerella sp. TaxID=2321398 RepID=UPI002941FD27|nr:FliA/WhiG family RNA polymerase sigma factor [uncultured Tyzzerella sp.]